MIYILISIILACLAVFSLSNTASLLMLPLSTPQDFLAGMPHISLTIFGHDYILIQPSSTFFVYLLGLVMIILGISFIVTKKSNKFPYYWGIGWILWGLGAILAGTSYQAIGYELKCKGLDYCLFTSNFELVYLLLTAYSINFLVAAIGYSSNGKMIAKYLLRFAIIDSCAYTIYLIIGAILPVKFLVSYEGFIAFVGLNFVLMFILNFLHYLRYKDILNRNLSIIWIAFLGVNLAYFLFLFAGFGLKIYQNYGIWFTANDLLHVLLILWAGLIFILLKNNARVTIYK